MRVYFASDHAGFLLKQKLMAYVSGRGLAIEDLGPYAVDPEDDYPDFVARLAAKVSSEPESRGIVIGGSGQGEAMAANRVLGVRALLYYGPARAQAPVDAEGADSVDGFDIVRLARRHNNANVLSLGARFLTEEDACAATRVFLETDFLNSPRHVRRIAKF